MSDVFLVLTTEYLRRLRFYWSIAVLVFIGGPLGFLGLIWLSNTELAADVVRSYDYLPLYMGGALLMVPILTLLIQWEIYPHLYVRPISTRAIAAWLMVTGAATIAGTNLLLLLAYRLLFRVEWPILAPTLFFVSFMLLAQCINWNLLKPTIFKGIGGLAVIAGALWWFAGRFHPEGFAKAMKPWSTPSAAELATMLAGSAAAALLGIHGLSRARHEQEGNPASMTSADVADPYVSSRVPRLAEVRQALNWFFWQRGLPYAATAAAATLLFLSFPFLFERNDLVRRAYDLEMLAGMCSYIPFISCAIVGTALGLDVRHPVQFRLMPFLATRPVTTRQLSQSLLWNAFKSTLLTWGLLVLGLVVYGTGFFLEWTPAELLRTIRQSNVGLAAIPLTLVGSFLASWSVLSWLAVLAWSGREKFFLLGIGLIIGLPVLFVVFVQFVVPSGWVSFLKAVGLWVPAVVIPIVTMDWTVAAWRGKLLSPESRLLLVILAAGLVAFFGTLVPASSSVKILVCLYSMAALLPIPAAPLMLEWNRHR